MPSEVSWISSTGSLGIVHSLAGTAVRNDIAQTGESSANVYIFIVKEKVFIKSLYLTERFRIKEHKHARNPVH